MAMAMAMACCEAGLSRAHTFVLIGALEVSVVQSTNGGRGMLFWGLENGKHAGMARYRAAVCRRFVF